MTNWYENHVLIRGPAVEIKRFKDRLVKVGNKYYPLLSAVPHLELKDTSELGTCIQKEICKTLWAFNWGVTELELIERCPEELELHFESKYGHAKYFGEDIFPRLSILNKYFEPMNNVHGFVHFVKGEVIASGHEEGEEQDSPWEIYDYNPWPVGVNPLEERSKNYFINTQDQLRSLKELNEYLKK
jgi:hypothetical protein